jgi:hypothetical protein
MGAWSGARFLRIAVLGAVLASSGAMVADAAETVALVEQPAGHNAGGQVEPYIRLHSADGRFRVIVMGDSLAEGMYSGLYRVLKDDARVTVDKRTKVNTGIVRSDRYDWNEAAHEIAREKTFDVAVVVFGANELQSIRENGHAYHFGQPGWVERFGRRVDDIIAALTDQKIATYWVGLPITRKDRYQDDYAYVNNLFREAAARNGIRYVETWNAFADANGEFTEFGPSLNGEEIQLRADDGVHFTPEGYDKYASLVADVLRKDVAAAEPDIAKSVCGPEGLICGGPR